MLRVECQSSKAFQVIQKVLYHTAKSHIVRGLPTGHEFLVFQKQLFMYDHTQTMAMSHVGQIQQDRPKSQEMGRTRTAQRHSDLLEAAATASALSNEPIFMGLLGMWCPEKYKTGTGLQVIRIVNILLEILENNVKNPTNER